MINSLESLLAFPENSLRHKASKSLQFEMEIVSDPENMEKRLAEHKFRKGYRLVIETKALSSEPERL